MKCRALFFLSLLVLFSCNKNESLGTHELSFVNETIKIDTLPLGNDTIKITLKVKVSGDYDGKGTVFFDKANKNDYSYYSSSSSSPGITIESQTNDQVNILVTKYVTEESGVSARLFTDGTFGQEVEVFVELPPVRDTFNIRNIVYNDNSEDFFTIGLQDVDELQIDVYNKNYSENGTVSADHKYFSFCASSYFYVYDFEDQQLFKNSSSKLGGFIKGTDDVFYYFQGSYSPEINFRKAASESFVTSSIEVPANYISYIRGMDVVYNQTDGKYYAAVFVQNSNYNYDLKYYNGTSWSTVFYGRSDLGTLKLSPDGQTIAWVKEEVRSGTFSSDKIDQLNVYSVLYSQESIVASAYFSESVFDIEGFDFSPDGSEFVLSLKRGTTNYYYQLFLLPSGGGSLSQLTYSNEFKYFPYWVE